MISRRAAIAGALAAVAPAARGEPAPFAYTGRPRQGGFIFGRAAPFAPISVDGTRVGAASASGRFIVGLDRDAPDVVRVSALEDGRWRTRDFAVAPEAWDVQRIDGLPVDQVEPSDPALLRRIQAEAALKARALASRDGSDGFANGFRWPVQGARRTSRFGGQRILNGQPRRPHYGVDLAVPVGTPITAPAPGVVVLAEPDMHFEGGLVLIDHGQGLVGMFLHQSKIETAAGRRVEAGEVIGLSGATGRVTGPHLCWRLKWRDRNLDPSLMVGAAAP